MSPPPSTLDGAAVLEWAVSKQGSFYAVEDLEGPLAIAAFAICKYANDRAFCCFKCDAQWNVIHDDAEASIAELKMGVESQTTVAIDWQMKSDF